MKIRGIEYLRNKLALHENRVRMRYKQYAMKYNEPIVGITIPPDIQQRYKAVLGWSAKGVDSLADRLVFREFAHDDFEVNEIFKANNPDVFFDSAILSALIASCSFVYISIAGELPSLQVIEASNARSDRLAGGRLRSTRERRKWSTVFRSVFPARPDRLYLRG